MKKLSFLIVSFAVLLVTGAAIADPEFRAAPLSDGLTFSTDFSYGDAFIRVTGPDDFIQDVEVASGGDLSISFDRGLADGLYKWQLLVVEPLTVEQREELLANRRLGGKYAAKGEPGVESHRFHGVFHVQDGAMVMASDTQLDETLTPSRDRPLKDIVQADDVIIEGSACVGPDCVDGENFGTDTLRLKGEELRFHFDDTSSSVPVSPTDNDWRIVINDSGATGANHWTLEDATSSRSPFRVEGGAPSAALVVEQDGDIGMGTFNPSVDLHVVDGDAPKLRLEQDGSIGFQNNAVDTDGAIVSILAGNGSANAQLWLGDVDDHNVGRIIYRNGPDAMSFWTNGAERVFIESDGQVCFGCNDTIGDAIRVANGAHLTSGGVWTNASSRGLKQDIHGLSSKDAKQTLAGLEPVTYRYKSESAESYVGFIAEDVPALVATRDRKGLAPMDIVAVLTKVVQDQQEAIDAQQRAMDAQQQMIEALSSRLEAIKAVD